jgi:hypothetical protein
LVVGIADAFNLGLFIGRKTGKRLQQLWRAIANTVFANGGNKLI